MTDIKLEQVIDAWTSERNQMLEINPEAVYFSTLLTDVILKLLATGEPVTAQDVSHLAKLPFEEVSEAFSLIRKQGGEFNDDENLVGLALSLNRSVHRFQIDGKQFYIWCALVEELKIISSGHYWECHSSNLLFYAPFRFFAGAIRLCKSNWVFRLYLIPSISDLYRNQHLCLFQRAKKVNGDSE